MVGISLALVMVLGSIPLGMADPLTECKNPEHLVVLRSNGDYVCLSEKSAQKSVERLGWELVTVNLYGIDPDPHTTKVGTENLPQLNIEDLQEQKANLWDKIEEAKQEIKTIDIERRDIGKVWSALDDEEVEEIERLWNLMKIEQQKIVKVKLKIIDYKTEFHQISIQIYNLENPDKEPRLPLNSTGYWVPIPEKDRLSFANLFVNAAGDSLTGELGKSGYLTEHGHISDSATVLYVYDLNIEPGDRKKFTEKFMDSMGFEYDVENIKFRDNKSYIWYHYYNEYSGVEFKFAPYMDEIKISFYGWTNNPELVTFHLSEEIAIQKAFDFIQTAEHYFINESDGGKCDVEITEPDLVIKYVEGGIPYYKIQVGYCTHSANYLIYGDHSVYVVMDGISGEEIFTSASGTASLFEEKEPQDG